MPVYSQQYGVLEARGWAETGGLYAILDACDTPSIPVKVETLGEQRAVSLYSGNSAEELSAIAPYVVAVDPETFAWITETLWSQPWGVFVRSPAGLEALRSHFRRFLLVESPAGDEWYFRFYDPRILGKYLGTCTADELADFFGPVSEFAITDPYTYGVTRIGPRPFLSGAAATPIRIHFKRAGQS